jgi:hypothetical protein
LREALRMGHLDLGTNAGGMLPFRLDVSVMVELCL